MCGVTAEVAGVGKGMDVASALGDRLGGAFISGARGPHQVSLTLFGQGKHGWVHLSVSRPHRRGATILVLAYPPNEE
ncbi:MAG: hypothetical protein QOH86_175 [Sphingomonadales bacterium]|jgi:hypothetical protein|nr:hypothetical protein [Sphingomonadales bacterium]